MDYIGLVQELAVDWVSLNVLFSDFMQGTICSTALFKHHHSGPDRPTQTKKPCPLLRCTFQVSSMILVVGEKEEVEEA